MSCGQVSHNNNADFADCPLRPKYAATDNNRVVTHVRDADLYPWSAFLSSVIEDG